MPTLIAVVLLVGGIVLVVLGLQRSRSVTDQAARVVLGRFTQRTLLLLIGGGVVALVGLALLL